ncbi:MAG: hypothetical protein HOA61_10705 [Bacteroidetes bacterium]|nr:hypothetical protein [Bacteroidota bacterium]
MEKKLIAIYRDYQVFNDWKILEPKIEKVFHGSIHIQKLIKAGCLAVGGDEESLSAAIIALCCVQKSIMLVDDILDNDPRGDHILIGNGRASNQAQAFLGGALQIIIKSDFTPNQKFRMIDVISKMIIDTSFGQNLDVNIPKTEGEYWKMVKAKSSPFYGALFEIGAIAGNPNSREIKKVRAFGDIYGEMIQIHDDLLDCLDTTPGPDWVEGRLPLPILFAEIVDHPERDEFIHLRADIEEKNNLEQAQKILISCGAVAYCVDQLFPREQLAIEIIESADGLDKRVLMNVLQEVMVAPSKLIENLEKSQV